MHMHGPRAMVCTVHGISRNVSHSPPLALPDRMIGMFPGHDQMAEDDRDTVWDVI